MKRLNLILLVFLTIPLVASGCQTQSSSVSWAWQAWVAVGTLLLAFVAAVSLLFGERIKLWFSHPNLNIEIQDGPPDCMMLPFGYPNTSDPRTWSVTASYWLRFRVINKRVFSAKQVEAYLSRVFRLSPEGQWTELKRYIPLNLTWSHADMDRTMERMLFPRVTKKIERHWDLGHFIFPGDRNDVSNPDTGFIYENPGPVLPVLFPEKSEAELIELSRTIMILHLDTAIKPSSRSYMLGPGTYKLEIRVNGENTKKPVTINIKVEVPETWELEGSGLKGVRVEKMANDSLMSKFTNRG